MICAAVFQIVARDGSAHAVFQINPAHGCGDALWFVAFKFEWFRRRYRAKSARPRATIACDHESSGALAPAFPTIRALRAFANRVQPQIGNERFGRKENWIRRQPHLDPRRFLRLVQCRINLRARHRTKVTTLKKLQKSNQQTAQFFNRAASSASRRAPPRTISVCLDSAAALTSASYCPFSPVGLQT